MLRTIALTVAVVLASAAQAHIIFTCPPAVSTDLKSVRVIGYVIIWGTFINRLWTAGVFRSPTI
jgi:hypothetical protein